MSFTCPVCSSVSFHPTDELAGYCGACHEFTGVQTDRLTTWTIYDHPSDHPEGYVARRWVIIDGVAKADAAVTSDSLAVLRFNMQREGRVCIDRAPEDDPVIVETWI